MPTIEDYVIERGFKAPLSKCIPDKENLRTHFTLKEIVSLARSLAEKGQIQPAFVELIEGFYHLVAGNKRCYGAEMAFNRGWTPTDYLVTTVTKPLPETLRLEIQRSENEHKERIPPHRLAESIWGKYILTLAKKVEDFSTREGVYEAEDYETIKELGVSHLLPIRDYAKLIGRDPKTISRYFSFQKLHTEIKKRISSGKISFNAACELSSIQNKNEQRSVLSSVIAKKEKPTLRRIRNSVKRYKEIAEAELLSPQRVIQGRTGKLSEISVCMTGVEHYMGVLESIAGFDSSVLDITAKIDGKRISPRETLRDFYNQMNGFHESFLEFNLYRKRWEHQPKKTTLLDLVSRKSSKKSEKNQTLLMERAVYMRINLDEEKVSPNPLNPRGKREDYDKKGLEDLAQNIKKLGVIQPLVLMRTGKKSYMVLEGHRRFYAIELDGLKGFDAIILPKLSREQQLFLMYDSDIFEEINKHDTFIGIARQYELERKANPKISIQEFCEQQNRGGQKVVREAVAYSNLTPEVRELCQRGIISYPVGILIGQLENPLAQKEFAQSAAVLRQSANKINQELEKGDSQQTLWSKEEFDKMKKEGQKKLMIERLRESTWSVCSRFQDRFFSEDDKKKFVQDYYLSHKFQNLFRTLEGTLQYLGVN
ncbi:MAG: ParB N-terminal domain-containing protein [archaeon]